MCYIKLLNISKYFSQFIKMLRLVFLALMVQEDGQELQVGPVLLANLALYYHILDFHFIRLLKLRVALYTNQDSRCK